MNRVHTRTLLVLSVLGPVAVLSSTASAQVTYTGSLAITDFRVGLRQGTNLTPFAVDHDESSVLASAHVMSSKTYTGTNDANQAMTYTGTGFADIQTALGQTFMGGQFSSDASVSLTSGSSSSHNPASNAFTSSQIIFTVAANGAYTLAGNGNITNLTGSGLFTFKGALSDMTTSTDTNFVVADNSTGLTPFSTSIDLVAGHTYSLYWSTQALTFVDGNNGPASSRAAMNGSLTLSTVPEPTTLAILGLGALAAIGRRRR